MDRLTAEERTALLPALDATGWTTAPGQDAIRKSLHFKDFSAAWGFLSRVALAAEALGHHPDWSNSYNRVEITLTTHDARGLTLLDIDLARRIDALALSAGVLPHPD